MRWTLAGRRHLNRHSPHDIQLRGNSITTLSPGEPYPLCNHPMSKCWQLASAWKAIWSFLLPSRHTSRVAISSPSTPSAYAGTGLRQYTISLLAMLSGILAGSGATPNPAHALGFPDAGRTVRSVSVIV